MNKTRADYREYLKTSHWDNLRVAALKRDGLKCSRCQAGGQVLQVHHKFYRDKWQDTELADLITLCVPCHQLEHNRRSKIVRRKKKNRRKHHRKTHHTRQRNPNGGFWPGMYEGITVEQVRSQIGTNFENEPVNGSVKQLQKLVLSYQEQMKHPHKSAVSMEVLAQAKHRAQRQIQRMETPVQ